jgi:23S rRNA (cytidine1920-2'-O)/16S rRNA (cytidine1409-2'-O)-methyltransferase
VVRSDAHRRDALLTVLRSAADTGLRLHGLTTSPIRGSAGNREYLGWWTPGAPQHSAHLQNHPETDSDLERLVAAVERPS